MIEIAHHRISAFSRLSSTVYTYKHKSYIYQKQTHDMEVRF